MTFLGAGIGYRRIHHEALLGGAGTSVLEIVPDHFFADPEAIEALAERHTIVFHDVGSSIATAADGALTKARLARLEPLVRLARPVLFSDHLALTRSPAGIDLGHLAPIWRSEEQLDLVVERVRVLQDALGVPLALENIAAPFEIPGGMSEPEFFERLVQRTGCGMLLDATNLLLTARNQGYDVHQRLQEYPLEAVRQVHLAGGLLDAEGVWVDSHSEPVEQESFALLSALGRCRESLLAIVIERDEHLGELAPLVAEAERAAQIWHAGAWQTCSVRAGRFGATAAEEGT
ncbi:MAG: DUF692 domain-containing protein [Deltaproteobacteria bacterium]